MNYNFKTTKKHFELFRKECKKWIDFFGLKDWDIYFYHQYDDSNGLAYSRYSPYNKRADVHLNTVWMNEKPTNSEIKSCSFHEICEVLYFPIRFLSEARFLTDGEVDTEIHRLIRILENTIYKKGRK